MSLDPQIAAVLALLEQSGAPALASGTPQQARAQFHLMTVGMRDTAALPPVASTEDGSVDGPAGPVPIRIYRPLADAPVPTVVFFHGGGFVIGDIDTHDDHSRIISSDLGAVVVSVDYRLAPEHPFPAGYEDCLAAARWAGAHIAELGGDPARLVVAGDSAGGNLAAAVALAARDGGPRIRAQLLLYPATDLRDDPSAYPSRVENATGYFLTADDMRWFGGHYLQHDGDAEDPRASVLLADLAGAPPAVIGTAGFDPLRDEGEAYAKALADAGVQVDLQRFDGLVHGFFGMGPMSPGCADAVRALTTSLKQLLD